MLTNKGHHNELTDDHFIKHCQSTASYVPCAPKELDAFLVSLAATGDATWQDH